MGKRFDNPDDSDAVFESLEVGDWSMYDQNRAIFIRLPEGNVCCLPLTTESKVYRDGGPVWDWNGNPDSPTLFPSILDMGTGWHGFMTNGLLVRLA